MIIVVSLISIATFANILYEDTLRKLIELKKDY